MLTFNASAQCSNLVVGIYSVPKCPPPPPQPEGIEV